MAKNDFFDVNHANLRLNATIVRLNNLPVYISEVREDWSVVIKYLLSGKSSTLPDIRTVEGLDISPVPLGFCQVGDTAAYLMRMPRRRTKQGLSEDSICMHNYMGRISVRESGAYAKALANTILGVYPSIKNALSILERGVASSVAISRNWSLSSKHLIQYKYFGNVGTYTGGQFLLDGDYSYLQECLEKEIINA